MGWRGTGSVLKPRCRDWLGWRSRWFLLPLPLPTEMKPGPISRLMRVCALQVVQSTRALQWIVDALKSQDHAAKDAPRLSKRRLCVGLRICTITEADEHSDWIFPAASPADEASDQTVTTTTRKEEQHHVKARQLNYPGSMVTRFPVPEEKVPWEVSCQHP